MATPIGSSGRQVPQDFQALPREIKQLLISFLGTDELVTGAITSKVFHALTSDNKVWVKIAQKYDIKLQDPKNAKKEILEAFYNVHNLNMMALKALESERYKVNKEVIFKEQWDPIALNISLRKKVNDNSRVAEFVRRVNEGMIQKLPGININGNLDPLSVHQKIIHHIKSNLEKLQAKSLEILREACTQSTYTPSDYTVFEALIKYGVVGNNPNASKISNQQYWQDVFSIVFGDTKQFSAIEESDSVLESILTHFGKADLPVSQKLDIIEPFYRKLNLNPSKFKLIEQFLDTLPIDETLLRTTMIRDYQAKAFSNPYNWTELFIKNSTLSNEQLLKIVDEAQAAVAKEETEKYKAEDAKDIAAGNEPESHTFEESMRSVRFDMVRKMVTSRVKGLNVS